MINFFKKNREIRRQVFHLTLPVITEQTFITLLGIINTMMASHISKEAAAAIGMIDSLNTIFIAVFSSLAVGGTVVVAHYTGKKDVINAGDASKQAIYGGTVLALVAACLVGFFRYPLMSLLYNAAEPSVLKMAMVYLEFTLPTYPLIALTSIACGVLRGAGNTKDPAKVVIMMNIVNIILSYVFIFGLSLPLPIFPVHSSGLGVPGAALGIGFARLLGTLVLIYILIRGSSNLKVDRLFHFQPDWEKLRSILNIGIPASLESLLFSTGKLITQTFIVATGTAAVVANYVGMSLHSLMVMPGSAFGVAATTLVGQNMGRGDSCQAKNSLGYLNKLSTNCLVGLNLLCFAFFPALTALYTPNREIIDLTALLLRATVPFMLVWPLAFVMPAGLKGAGDVRFTLAVSTASMWIFRITLGYILCIHLKWGVLGVWAGMYADWVIRGILFWIRFKNGNWQKHEVITSSENA